MCKDNISISGLNYKLIDQESICCKKLFAVLRVPVESSCPSLSFWLKKSNSRYSIMSGRMGEITIANKIHQICFFMNYDANEHR